MCFMCSEGEFTQGHHDERYRLLKNNLNEMIHILACAMPHVAKSQILKGSEHNKNPNHI